MSRKKKRKKVQLGKGLRVLIALSCFLIVVIIGLVFFHKNTGEKTIFKKNTFKVESRSENIKAIHIDDDSVYEAIGWLRVQGTDLDMPILYTDSEGDNPFPVELESYAWTRSSDKSFHNRIRIFGHNIFNLGDRPKIQSDLFNRFEELMAFVYYDFAKENKYIQLTLDGEDYVYKIFAVGFVPTVERVYFPIEDDYTQDEMKTHLEMLEI